MIFMDYVKAKECVNRDAWELCMKCGQCGRVFDDEGCMTDAGGTTPEMEEE